MTSEEIRDRFAEATSLMQLVTIAQSLKGSGEDEKVVNQRLSEARRNLMKTISAIPKIQKIAIPEIGTESISHLAFRVESLNTPVVKLDENCFVI